RRAVVLRDVDVRGADDVDQDGQRAVPLHRLDDRPCPLRSARLGRVHLLRQPLLPDSPALWTDADVQRAPHFYPFLDRDHWHRALHFRDVGRRRDAGSDVARGELRRHAHLCVHRKREGDLSVLCRPLLGRRVIPRWYADHGLQRPHDDRRQKSRGCADSRGGHCDGVTIKANAEEDLMKLSQELVEKNTGLLVVLIILVVSVGGLAEIVPLFFQKSTTEAVAGLKPYTALQLSGRDVYIREGCNNCHSKMIRLFRAETERYGHYSVAGEFVYDHPHLWGSKRTGPDLHRDGGRYSDEWHRLHLDDPRQLVPESNMPAYPWLGKTALDTSDIEAKMRALRLVSV